MNIYDFDGTIYDGDSTIDFYKYCLNRYPKARVAILGSVFGVFLYLFGRIDKTRFKEHFFSFLKYIPNPDEAVESFWNIHEKKIKAWYLEQKRNSDIIISASPEFLLAPICAEVCVTLIGSRVDKMSGAFDGENCYGLEKVQRLALVADISEANTFYTDSLADKPLADKIPNTYIIKGDRLIPWNEYKPSALSRVKHTFFTPEFFTYVFSGGVGTVAGTVVSGIIATRIDPTVSYIFGYAVALSVTYNLTSVLVFKSTLSIRKFIKFLISYIPNFCILFTLVIVFINLLGWHHIVTYIFAALFGLPITFLILKMFAFAKSHKN